MKSPHALSQLSCVQVLQQKMFSFRWCRETRNAGFPTSMKREDEASFCLGNVCVMLSQCLPAGEYCEAGSEVLQTLFPLTRTEFTKGACRKEYTIFFFLLWLHRYHVLTQMNILISQPFTFNIQTGHNVYYHVHYPHNIGCFASDYLW